MLQSVKYKVLSLQMDISYIKKTAFIYYYLLQYSMVQHQPPRPCPILHTVYDHHLSTLDLSYQS